MSNCRVYKCFVFVQVHRRGPGIVGIERNLEEKSRATDKTITQVL